MPAGPTPGLVFVQPHIALFSLELGFDVPPGAAHLSQRFQGSLFRSVGQVVAGFASVQVAAVDGPVDFAGLPPAGWPHPLRAEHTAAGPLAPLGNCYFLPGILWQFINALHHGTPLSAHQLGFGGRPALVGRIRPSGSSGRTVECGLQTQKGHGEWLCLIRAAHPAGPPAPPGEVHLCCGGRVVPVAYCGDMTTWIVAGAASPSASLSI